MKDRQKLQAILIGAIAAALIIGLAGGYVMGRHAGRSAGTASSQAAQTIAASGDTSAQSGASAASSADSQAGTSQSEQAQSEDTADAETPGDADTEAAAEAGTEAEEAAAQYDIGDHEGEGQREADPSQIDNAKTTEAKEESADDGSAPTYDNDKAVMQIVVMGDSQFGNFRGKNGLAYLLKQYCNANVYNLAIGGTCAAVTKTEGSDSGDKWESVGGAGMVQLAAGKVPSSILDSHNLPYTKKVYEDCDFSKTDVFVLEYGINDYLNKIPLSNDSNALDVRSYRGALTYCISTLRKYFPKAKIVVATPTYCQFFASGTGEYLGDGNILSNGVGTVTNYVDAAQNVVEGMNGDADVMNAYYYLDINSLTAKQYLLDGIHMNSAGRVLYAKRLARKIIIAMGYDVGQEEDVTEIDWQSRAKK
ncbi:MAG: SGNH/GDSL hydrolase family protein [Lachnospiraceae bacterium]|nr:SGNH/GDSL hydrolase family protein [Lachnospiraceae bacterium]